MSQNDATTLVDHYFDAWNTDDEKERSRALELAWSQDGSYVDPTASARGREAVGEMMGAVRQKYPGIVVSRTSAVDEHNGLLRFSWDIRGTDGDVLLTGIDFGEMNAEGLSRIVGFHGDPPPLEAR